MRLNKFERRQIIRSIRKEMPAIPHATDAEKLARECYAKRMPQRVRAIYDDPALRPFLNTEHVLFLSTDKETRLHVAVHTTPDRPALPERDQKRITRLLDKHQAAETERRTAVDRIADVLESCSTIRQARERLPAPLHKHLPADERPQPPKKLPAPTDLMHNLRKVGYRDQSRPSA